MFSQCTPHSHCTLGYAMLRPQRCAAWSVYTVSVSISGVSVTPAGEDHTATSDHVIRGATSMDFVRTARACANLDGTEGIALLVRSEMCQCRKRGFFNYGTSIELLDMNC